LALGFENHPDMSFKDTTVIIRLNEVFTATNEMAEAI
jgi:hypothetical protein